MSEQEAKARALVAKAEKKLASWSFFGGNKYEDAVELLEKAANNFKLAKCWKDAGETFEKLADCHSKLESAHEVASSYVDAANAYKKVSLPDAITALDKASVAFTDMGRLGMAAKNLRDIGDIHEQQGEKEQAVEYHTQAADLFSGEESSSEANKCRLKAAHLSAELGRYKVAFDTFEAVSLASMDNNLLRYSAKGYLLNAGLCRLCHDDIVSVRNAIERYEDMDPSFSGCREQKLLADVADAVDEGDVPKFTQVIGDYDRMSRLDPWKTSLLLVVKKKLMVTETEGDDLT